MQNEPDFDPRAMLEAFYAARESRYLEQQHHHPSHDDPHGYQYEREQGHGHHGHQYHEDEHGQGYHHTESGLYIPTPGPGERFIYETQGSYQITLI